MYFYGGDTMYRFFKKLSDCIFKSDKGYLYLLKTLSVLAVFQMVYSVFFYPQNYDATVELFGGGCMTAVMAVACPYLVIRLKNSRKK